MVHVFKQTDDSDKVEKVLAKLCQIDCISNKAVVEWACNSINAKDATVSYEDLVLELNIIIQALQREASNKWLTVTMFQQKPPTVQTQEDEADASENTGGEESKNAEIKMEVSGEFGDENNGRRNNAGY